jgi:hypothetical protein
MGTIGPLEGAIAPLQAAGLQVEVGDNLSDTATAKIGGRGEAIGIIAALLTLVCAFGAVVSAELPIAVALVGLGVGSGGIPVPAAASTAGSHRVPPPTHTIRRSASMLTSAIPDVRTRTTSSSPWAASGAALWPVLCGATRRLARTAARTTRRSQPPSSAWRLQPGAGLRRPARGSLATS